MDTSRLKSFAQEARRLLKAQVWARLDQVLAEQSAARREQPKAVEELEKQIAATDQDQVIEKVAYTWFNRFSALRFMDANGYTGVRLVSPAEGQTRPEVLSEAAAGHIGDEVPADVGSKVTELLDGRAPSNDPQGEAYRLLLVAACNHWHSAMPFMFEKIADYTELLMPEDLLSNESILAKLCAAMTEETCQDVEVIGWLYQFYISEKKDEVFAGLKNNKKITAENIPAATQLFTPHWIVRYLVENSLGRLWMLNRPSSRLVEAMDYYIAPEEPETDFLKIEGPEEIKICDPACGSGHMLTYAFDLLYAIYEEEGYDPSEIPALIFTNNLFGIEIDERAGALAAFALTMKAAGKRKRFLRSPVQPNVCVLENVSFREDELPGYIRAIGEDLFTRGLRDTLNQFADAKNCGSLIVPKLNDVASVREQIAGKDLQEELFIRNVHERVQTVLRMADALSAKYHVVVANPPYKLRSDLNRRLATFLDEIYPKSKTDLFSAFIERSITLAQPLGYNALVTMESWMFLASYEKLRQSILDNHALLGLTHMPYLGKGGTPMGISFGTDAKILQTFQGKSIPATFCCIRYFETDDRMVPFEFPARNERLTVRSAQEFKNIPGSPIAYWVEEKLLALFREQNPFAAEFDAKQGIATGENEKFLRQWHEVSRGNLDVHQTSFDGFDGQVRWYPYSKGGEARRWYGNHFLVVDWAKNGECIRNFKDENGKLRSRPQNLDFQFKKGVTWSLTSSSNIPLCARFRPSGFMFDVNGMSAFPKEVRVPKSFSTALLNSYVPQHALKFINPTMAFQSGDISRIPMPKVEIGEIDLKPAERCIMLSISDWDACETSWEFVTLPLLEPAHQAVTLETTYDRLRNHWQSMTDEMQRLEGDNNRIFIDAYDLQDEQTPKVPLHEITLTCNPAYRYGIKNDAEANEVRLRADTMAEFLSYAVGCMFGRYSLDEPGLILANQGETLEDYLKRIPEPTFQADAENVIPILDGDWFPDDITERFRKFLRVTFGEEHFEENLAFIEEALGKDIRRYFLRDFYNDHVKRYKKRPIYWLFSSPKGSFNALIYMHRYNLDTVSVVLNDYLREYRNKLEAHRKSLEALSINSDATEGERTKALKQIGDVSKVIDELDDYERDVLFPLATQRIAIDLDDGVKANYPIFGSALKKITGLSDAGD